MARTSLHQFVARILADDRILFGDLKRLQRDILPARVTTREEAEILLFLDSAVHRADREWTAYLTATVRDFAVWGLHPAGSVNRDKAEWIAAALSGADPTRTTRVILREIVHEARQIDAEALRELGLGPGASAAAPRPVSRSTGPLRGVPVRGVPERGVGACAVWSSSSVRTNPAIAQD